LISTEYGHSRSATRRIVGHGRVDRDVLEAERGDAAALVGIAVVGADAHHHVEPPHPLRERARVQEDRLVALVVVGDELGRIGDDVQVAAEDEVHALERQRLVGIVDVVGGQVLVLVEAEVRHDHDQVDHRPQQAHVLLERLLVGDGADPERVAALEDAGHRAPVGHADDADLEALDVVDGVRVDHVLERRRVRVGRILEDVVGGQQRVLGVVADLLEQVDRAQVELVVADDGAVHAGQRQGPHLGLALEAVEHRRALEAVARVEPQRPVGGGADVASDGGHARDPTERRVGRQQAILALEPVGHERVGEQPRVDVRGVDEGEADVLPHQVGLRLLDGAGGAAEQPDRRRRDRRSPRERWPTHRGGVYRWADRRRKAFRHGCGRPIARATCHTIVTHAPHEDRLHHRPRVCNSPERIGELIDAGLDVARLNFSHGSHEDHAKPAGRRCRQEASEA
jgi:hypothetical protein